MLGRHRYDWKGKEENGDRSAKEFHDKYLITNVRIKIVWLHKQNKPFRFIYNKLSFNSLYDKIDTQLNNSTHIENYG